MKYFGRKDEMKDYRTYNDYELIYMVAEKDEDAFSLLYHKYYPLLKKYAGLYYQYYKSYGVEYDDLCQETYLAFDRAVRYYRDDEDTLFYTFLCITIRSRILNYIKKFQSKKNSIYLDTLSLEQIYPGSDQCLGDYIENPLAPDPENEFFLHEVSNHVQNFRLSLDDESSQIFEMYWNGFSNSEISELLEIDFTKVISKLRRIRRLLREYLRN